MVSPPFKYQSRLSTQDMVFIPQSPNLMVSSILWFHHPLNISANLVLRTWYLYHSLPTLWYAQSLTLSYSVYNVFPQHQSQVITCPFCQFIQVAFVYRSQSRFCSTQESWKMQYAMMSSLGKTSVKFHLQNGNKRRVNKITKRQIIIMVGIVR